VDLGDVHLEHSCPHVEQLNETTRREATTDERDGGEQ
jgi:phage FluMu protein Com